VFLAKGSLTFAKGSALTAKAFILVKIPTERSNGVEGANRVLPGLKGVLYRSLLGAAPCRFRDLRCGLLAINALKVFGLDLLPGVYGIIACCGVVAEECLRMKDEEARVNQ
jgi:hypothetical protein